MEGGSPTPHSIIEDNPNIPQFDGNVSISSTDSCEYDDNPIPVIISSVRQPKLNITRGSSSITVIKYNSKKVLTASKLPVVVNLNPRSIYNKKEEFKIMMEQLDVDICFMSESWDREKTGLEEVIRMDNHQIIRNIVQRSGKGGSQP